MLKEDQVVDFTCEWLKKNGFTIQSTRKGSAKGDDITAINPEGILTFIECKGSGFKKPFSTTAQWQKLSGAFFNQIRLSQEQPQAKVGLALAKNAEYEEMLLSLRSFLQKLQIIILWVDDSGVVTKWS